MNFLKNTKLRNPVFCRHQAVNADVVCTQLTGHGVAMKSGFLIAVEGIDGAGKTTQVGLLEKYLQTVDLPVVRSKEPTDGPWGKKIRASAATGRMPLEDELAAFIEDRREHVRDVINPALEAGKVVILDRYFYSTIAYQGSRGGDVEAIERQMLAEFPIPDVVYLIDVPAEMGVARVRQGRGEVPNEFEQTDVLRRCRDVFLSMFHRHDNIARVCGEGSDWLVRHLIHQHLIEKVLPPHMAKLNQQRRTSLSATGATSTVQPVLDA